MCRERFALDVRGSPWPTGRHRAMAERKLPFRVVYASSEDADYPAGELDVHSPQTRGWQSARFCEWPQELGVWFPDGAVAISQVQLLSHQSKIATRVELFVGTGASAAEYDSARFTRLGYLSLDSNERSNYKVCARCGSRLRRLWRHRAAAQPAKTRGVCHGAVCRGARVVCAAERCTLPVCTVPRSRDAPCRHAS